MEMLFAGIAGGIMIAVLLIYIRNVLYANIGMNLSTWLIATVGLLVQNITYYPTVDGELHLLFVPTVVSVGLIIISVLGWRKGTFGKVEWFDIFAMALTAFCLVEIGFDGYAIGGLSVNVILQAALFMSFIPTIRDLRAKKFEDDPFPWGLGALSFIFQAIAVTISVEVLAEDWPRLINPILVGFPGNLLVCWAAFTGKRKPA